MMLSQWTEIIPKQVVEVMKCNDKCWDLFSGNLLKFAATEMACLLQMIHLPVHPLKIVTFRSCVKLPGASGYL